jgi:hypothetical protein
MTTKPPSKVEPAPDDSLEKIAYGSIEGIPTVAPHDLDRLGHNIWFWLKYRRDPLDVVVRTARARFLIGEAEAIQRISAKLESLGVNV